MIQTALFTVLFGACTVLGGTGSSLFRTLFKNPQENPLNTYHMIDGGPMNDTRCLSW